MTLESRVKWALKHYATTWPAELAGLIRELAEERERFLAQVHSLRHTLGRVQLLDPKGVVACHPEADRLAVLIERVEEVTTENNHLILDALFAKPDPNLPST